MDHVLSKPLTNSLSFTGVRFLASSHADRGVGLDTSL